MSYWLQRLQPLLLDRPSREGLGKVMAVLAFLVAGEVWKVGVGYGSVSQENIALVTSLMILLFFVFYSLRICADDIASPYKQDCIFLVSISMQYIIQYKTSAC